MDRKTRKLITIYGGLHPRSCVDRLCIPRCDGGRGLVSVEDCVEEEKCNLEDYAVQSKEALVKTSAAELNFEKYIVSVSKKEKKENRLKELKQKTLRGQFVREAECRGKESWKVRLKVSFALHKSKLLELIQWSITLTRPVKLHVAGFATKMLKVSQISLVSALVWQRTNTEKGMIK